MSSCTTPWYARIPTPSNIADEPSRGATQRFIQGRIPETSVCDGLQEIMLALAENTVMRGSSSWAAELVGTLMEFLWRRFMWLLNLCFFFPAIYVIAGTGDSHIGTTDRRFDLHSPLSLVSKKVRDLRHFIVLEEHVAFKIVWQWKPFWWTDGLSLNVLEKFWNGLVWTHLCLG